MKNIFISSNIAIIFTALCSYMRGGVTDAPIVLIVFFSTGFFVSLFLLWFLNRKTLSLIDRTLKGLPYSDIVRNIAALILVVTTFFWSGRVIQNGGYVGWLIAFFLWIAAPLVVCLLATKYVVFYGALINSCILLSSYREDARYYARSEDFWDIFWRRDIYTLLIVLAISIAISLLISIPIMLRRRKNKQSLL